MNWVKLQVQEEKVQDAILELFMIADQLEQNPLTEISLSNYEDKPLILVPVSLDDHSFELGRHAITLARRISADIKFLHIYFESNEAYSNFATIIGRKIHIKDISIELIRLQKKTPALRLGFNLS